MKQHALAKWLKGAILGVGLCGLVVYLLLIPLWGRTLAGEYPEFARCYLPWLIFLWLTALPCCGALVLGWRVAGNVGRDRSFTRENARYLKGVAGLAAGDAAFFFLGNLVLLLLSMNHPGIVLCSLLVVLLGAAVSVAAACLSHLVGKAAELQDENDLTI